jgi:hypothetical protein
MSFEAIWGADEFRDYILGFIFYKYLSEKIQRFAEAERKNRYDVTLLINGLPLVQIEIKRRSAELKVAFHQINRYQHNSYDAGFALFQYVQLFIISNGVNAKKNKFASNKVYNMGLLGVTEYELLRYLQHAAAVTQSKTSGKAGGLKM